MVGVAVFPGMPGHPGGADGGYRRSDPVVEHRQTDHAAPPEVGACYADQVLVLERAVARLASEPLVSC
jgi:hypothetical protein